MNALARTSLRHPLATLATTLLVTGALGAGALRLETDAGYRAFLGSGHPAIVKLDAFAARFGGGLPFAVVWSCDASRACTTALDDASLAMAHRVARALEAVPGVRRVDGPATSPLLFQPEIGLPEARRLAPEGLPARDIATLRRSALEDPTWVHHLVSLDGRAGALVIHLADSRSNTGVRAYGALDAALAPFEAAGFEFARVGGPVEFVVAGAELERGARRLVPAMVGLVALALLVLFRAPGPSALALATAGLAVVWTLGLQGWLGWPQNSLTHMLPPLVLVIAVCDAVHLLANAAVQLGASHEERTTEDALRAAVAEVGTACALTTLTTAAGLASFAVGGLESLARFGLLGAFGTLAALALGFSALPVVAARLPARSLASSPAGAFFQRTVAAAQAAVRRRPTWILGAAALGSAGAALGVGQLEMDARFEDLYGRESQVVRWADAAAKQLRESETLEIAIEVPPGVELEAPEALATAARVSRALAALPGLGEPLSLHAPLDRAHRLLHGTPLPIEHSASQADDELARTRTRQMMRLLRLEEPALIELFADVERPALRVSLLAAKAPQRELRALMAEVDRQLAEQLPAGYSAVVTGPLATVAAMIDELRATQLQGFSLAALLVFVLVTLFFRSPVLGAVAMLPTVLPVLWTLGAMGALGHALDVGSAMVAAVILGLAVDDAIHFLVAWRRRFARGEAAGPAALGSLGDVGRPLITTSLALMIGFSTLAFAPWNSIASFGAVSAISILAALVAALLVLPAALVVFDPGSRPARVPDSEPPLHD